MLGAIAGDVIGSVYERQPIKHKDFPLFSRGSTFTDDSVLTCAVAQVLLDGGDYADAFRQWFRRYPDRGFGAGFYRWAMAPAGGAYGSFGNGSAMRVSPVAWACRSLDEALDEARRSAQVTHDHPEGIKGAQATAAAVFLARNGTDRDSLRDMLEQRFGYDLHRRLDALRPHYRFDVSCQGSVPEALLCYLESDGYEDAVRNAVSLGGDADTMAAIAGAVAEAGYGGVPVAIRQAVLDRLEPALRDLVQRFETHYGLSAAESATD